ncbi:hypothetical protein Scep_024770 [Stephania cephalantha]|uniref:Uncharacterized protein n=1 Tax=Stephania cephalantha TaxID=152367 RepID=A0AAP0HYS0_9MAGN
MLKGLLGSRSNTVEPSHPFLQGPLGESWKHDGTKSPRPLEELWTHGGIKSPTHIYYIMIIGQQGKVELDVPDRYLGLVQVSGLSSGLGRATQPYFSRIMSNQSGNSYNLRETSDRDERNWRAQMEQRMTVMAETYQKAIHDMRSAQDQRVYTKWRRGGVSVAAAEEDCGESQPPLEEGGSNIIAAAATHGGASTKRPHERKHERRGDSHDPPLITGAGRSGAPPSKRTGD